MKAKIRQTNMRCVSLLRLGLYSLLLSTFISGNAKCDESARKVQQWVDHLSSESYALREAAMAELILAGGDGINAISEEVVRGDLEVVTRGIAILRQLALSDDSEVELAARASLEEIAAAKVTAAAKRANQSLQQLNLIRQDRAVKKLSQLGAKIGRYVDLETTKEQMQVTIDSGTWKGSEKDIQQLRFLSDAARVQFTGKKVNDAWIKQLASLPKLTSVTLRKPDLTLEGVAALTEVPDLRALTIQFSAAIDDQAIPHFQNIKKLTVLRLYGAKLSTEGLKKLEDSISAELDVRKGGLLGITGSDPVWGAACEVQHVQPGSAAEKAGLQPSDIISKYNGNEITSFRQLTEKIAKHAPGEKVKLEIKRGNETLEREVTLGSWEEVSQAGQPIQIFPQQRQIPFIPRP